MVLKLINIIYVKVERTWIHDVNAFLFGVSDPNLVESHFLSHSYITTVVLPGGSAQAALRLRDEDLRRVFRVVQYPHRYFAFCTFCFALFEGAADLGALGDCLRARLGYDVLVRHDTNLLGGGLILHHFRVIALRFPPAELIVLPIRVARFPAVAEPIMVLYRPRL